MEEIGIGEESLEEIEKRVKEIIKIGIMEGDGEREGKEIKEYIGEIRNEMKGEVLIEKRKKIIEGKEKNEGWIDKGKGGEGKGSKIEIVVKKSKRINDREEGGGIMKGGEEIGIEDLKREGNGWIENWIGEVIGGKKIENKGRRLKKKKGKEKSWGIEKEGKGGRVRMVVGNEENMKWKDVEKEIVNGLIKKKERMEKDGRIEFGKRGIDVERGYNIREKMVGDNKMEGKWWIGMKEKMGEDIIEDGEWGKLSLKKIGMKENNDVIVKIKEKRNGNE